MRIFWQALAGSFVLHLVYIGILFLVGLLKTYFYKPQFATGSTVLQSEMSFGVITISPIVYVSSFVIAAILIALVLIGRKQFKKQY